MKFAAIFLVGMMFIQTLAYAPLTKIMAFKAQCHLNAFFESEIVTANDGVQHEPQLGAMIRFIAHDCIAGSDGGCTGCLNMNVKANTGFEYLFGALNRLYSAKKTVSETQAISDVMSRADFWVMASYVAARRATKSRALRLRFRYGREDCPTSPFTNKTVVFPNAQGGYQETVELFRQRLGFTKPEVVALLGAHTLGRARMHASGFDGVWVTRPDVLDNEYYQALMNNSKGWHQVDVSRPYEPKRFQWASSSGDHTFMLNTDMSLLKELTLTKGKSSCNYADCAFSEGVSSVRAYARSNSKFLRDFSKVFQKFTEGDANLSDLQGRRVTKRYKCKSYLDSLKD